MNIQLCIFTIFLLCFSVGAHAGESADENDPFFIKDEITKKWEVERSSTSDSYTLTSPIYPLEYKEGCVMYQQFLPRIEGKISFSRMEHSKLYYANAFDSGCSKVKRDKFFTIGGESEPYAVLDFIRRAYLGPKVKRDRISKGDLSRIRECFLPDKVESISVSSAESMPTDNSISMRYVVIFRCQDLKPSEEIVVMGKDSSDRISWRVQNSLQVDVHAID